MEQQGIDENLIPGNSLLWNSQIGGKKKEEKVEKQLGEGRIKYCGPGAR